MTPLLYKLLVFLALLGATIGAQVLHNDQLVFLLAGGALGIVTAAHLPQDGVKS